MGINPSVPGGTSMRSSRFLFVPCLFLIFVLLAASAAIAGPADPPQVDSTDPADGATAQPIDIAPSATFAEGIDDTTLNTTSFFISGGVTGTVSYDPATFTATFTPDADLDQNTTYTVTVTQEIQSTGGAPMDADYTWSFTTEDQSVFRITDVSPADEAVDQGPGTAVVITFNRDVRESLINADNVFLLNAFGNKVAGTRTTSHNGEGEFQITFTPHDDLEMATVYALVVRKRIKDLDGNTLQAGFFSSFRTRSTIDDTDCDGAESFTDPDDQDNSLTARNSVTTNGQVSIECDTGVIAAFKLWKASDDIIGWDTQTINLYDFTHDFASFQIWQIEKGATVTVHLTFPDSLPNPVYLMKYINKKWKNIDDATVDGNTFTFTLTDGEGRDADGYANGVICDPLTWNKNDVGIDKSDSGCGGDEDETGCTLGENPESLTWLALTFIPLLLLLRRRGKE